MGVGGGEIQLVDVPDPEVMTPEVPSLCFLAQERQRVGDSHSIRWEGAPGTWLLAQPQPWSTKSPASFQTYLPPF